AQVAAKLQPEDPAILFVLAQAESLAGAPDVAAKTFERASAMASDAMTFYRLGRIARVEEQPFKAEQLFARAAESDPAFALPHIELAELTLERIDLTPKDGHPALIEKATAAIAAAEKADKDAAGLRIAKAHLLALQDKNDEARPLLMEEVKLHPYREEGWVILANVYAAEANDAEATKTLEQALANGIETAEVYEGLGTLYASTGRFDEGKRMIERALDKNPEDPTYRTQLAQFERHGRNFARARELLEAQVKKFPDDLTSNLLLAQLELEQEQPGKARVQVDKVLKRDPDNVEARVFRHMIAATEGKTDPAERQSAIEAIGGSRQLAELFLKNGLIDEAEVILKEAIAADNDDLVIPVLLSAIYMAQNRVPEATAIREATLAKVDGADRSELAKLFDEAIAQALEARDAPAPAP
ncbi:MAG TPA: tetratricopeptide repeat protein, partial [Myxococcota bacterium]|nr:tetratricopeptide repeat protein [Myxococcota bacterium]